MREDYPYMVVPFDKDEEEKAKTKGIPSTFCADIDVAIEVMTRQNKYSNVLWRIKPTEDEVLNWNL